MTSAPQEEGQATPQTKTVGEKKAKRALKWLLGLGGTLIAALVTLTTIFGPINPQNLLGLNVTPLPGPTPLAFEPCKPGESCIVVANFEPRAGADRKIDPAQTIFEKLKDQVQRDNLKISLRRLRQTVDDNTARTTGEAYNATLLIWGWYDEATIGSRIERFGLINTYLSDQEGKRFSLDAQKSMAEILTDDLPEHVNYVTMIILGMEVASNRDFDTANRYFDIAIASVRNTDNVNPNEAFFLRGWLHEVKGHLDNAILDYSRALTVKPEESGGHYTLGNAYYKRGDYSRAIESYSKAIALNPNFAAAFNNRGIASTKTGKYEKAIEDYSEAIRLAPNDADAWNNRGSAYSSTDRQQAAIQDFDEAIKLNPDFAEAFYNRGNAYDELLQYDLAIRDYDKAILLKPDYVDAFINRGIVYDSMKKYELAIEDYSTAIALKPDDAKTYYNRGNTYFRQEQYDLAIEDFGEALKRRSQYAEAFNNRGIAHYTTGNYDLAIQDFDKVIEITPNDPEVYGSRGLAYAMKQDYARAIGDFDRALEINPKDPLALYNRGLVYMAKGDKEEAIADLKSSLELIDVTERRNQIESLLRQLEGN
jgi:tetratricopeptide (TPR) repeat protein